MPRPRVPLLFLLAAAALAGAVGTGSALDLFRRPVSIARNNALEDAPLTFYRFALGGGRVQPELTAPVYVAMPRLPEQRTLGLLSGGTGVRGTGWLIASALPGALLGLALLALLVWAFVSAWRRSLYGGRALRLLTVAGIVALAGGPLVALGEAAAARWAAPPNYNYTPTIAEWQVALVLALLGLALLAVREILGRAGELHAELETVI